MAIKKNAPHKAGKAAPKKAAPKKAAKPAAKPASKAVKPAAKKSQLLKNQPPHRKKRPRLLQLKSL